MAKDAPPTNVAANTLNTNLLSMPQLYQICARGGCAAAVLAAADELAVQAFLDGKIKYTDIAATVADCLEHAPEIPCDSLDAVWEAVKWVEASLG